MKPRIMFNVKFRYVWTLSLMLISMTIAAQEICNNGIDDDGDSLVDLNDDECGCSVIEPLTYVNGSLCTDLELVLEYPEATSFQWYHDGIAIEGETDDKIILTVWIPNVEGNYQVLIEHPGGCVISECYDAILETFKTDLGELYLCAGDTLVLDELVYEGEVIPIVPPRIYTGVGEQSFKTSKPSDGCDLRVDVDIVQVIVNKINIDTTFCFGGTFTSTSGNIVTTESGIFYDTLQNRGGCDSIITFTLTEEVLMPIEFSASVCAGETYDFYGRILTETGTYSETPVSSSGCDTTYTIDLVVGEELIENIDTTICSGDLFILGDINTSTAGPHSTTIITSDGCDSLINVLLSIDEPEQIVTDQAICIGSSFEWRGETYDTAGTYTDMEIMPGGCIQEYVLNLSVDDVARNVDPQTICQGLSYSWMGNEYSETGVYDTLIQVPGNCDVLEVLDLTVTPPDVEIIDEVICEGNTYELGDIKEDSSGTYYTTMEVPGECDISYEVNLTVIESTSSILDTTLCAGTFELFDLTIDIPGSHIAHTINSAGCDSTIYVELVAGFIDPTIIEESICPGDFIVFQGTEYGTEGDHPVILQSVSGCDSIVTLSLSFSNSLEVSFDEIICDGESYNEYGLDVTTTGVYFADVNSATGCDSSITVNVTVLEKDYYAFDAEICAGEVYSGVPGISTSDEGSHMAVLQNEAGCDSIVTVTLSVISDEPNAFVVEICDGDIYTNNTIVATESGFYDANFDSEMGCDSTIIVEVQVLPLNLRVEEMSICAGDVISFYGQEITESGSYTERFTNENGCDSLVTYNIDVNAGVGNIVVMDSVVINLGATEDIEPAYVDESFVIFEWLDEQENIISTDKILTDYSPSSDTYLDFVATNEEGCEVRERIIIDVNLVVEIYAPNVIIPDGNNLDSNFRMGANESVVGIEEIHIYDRWGELMFRDSHEGRLQSYVGWDGVFKGKTVNPGVFTYAAVFRIVDGSFVTKAGSVTVLR